MSKIGKIVLITVSIAVVLIIGAYLFIGAVWSGVFNFMCPKEISAYNSPDGEYSLVFEQMGEIRKQTGDRAVERAIHFYNENKRVERLANSLANGDFEAFKKTIIESGKSSYMYNQNCYTLSNPNSQPVALALCLTEELLKGKGAYRVHGGGFAGTIQAFVPVEETDNYVSAMKKVFGENSCYILKVRSYGGCEI